jgi:hypothetical protein
MPGNAIIWSGEDGVEDTLVPRLLAARADLSRIKFVGDVTKAGRRVPFDPAVDVEGLASAARKLGDVSLLIIDPLVSAVGADSYKNAEVRRALAPLLSLAEELDAALMGITHFSKNTAGRDPIERVTGSIAFGAMARIVFGTARRDQEDEGQTGNLMFARAKSNIGPDGAGFRYDIEEVEIPEYVGLRGSRIAWGEPATGTAKELLTESRPEMADSNDGVAFLNKFLATGPRPASEVFAEGERAGLSPDQIKRAKSKVGVHSDKLGMGGGWQWKLPSATQAAKEGSEGCAHQVARSSHSSNSAAPPSADLDVLDV